MTTYQSLGIAAVVQAVLSWGSIFYFLYQLGRIADALSVIATPVAG